MRSYSVRDVQRVCSLPRHHPQSHPGRFRPSARGARREYRFSFQDLIVLRTARALLDARIPKKRIRRSLESLRRNLPESIAIGLASARSATTSWCATGMRAGSRQRPVPAGSGRESANGVLHVVEHRQAAPAPVQDWFAQALDLESSDPDAALSAYRCAVDSEPHNAAAWTNWDACCTSGAGPTKPIPCIGGRWRRSVRPAAAFNQGVLLEDLGKSAAALAAYQTALEEDPDLADCHYNLARLYEALGKPQHAIRHLVNTGAC